jgi:hypothetical protein
MSELARSATVADRRDAMVAEVEPAMRQCLPDGRRTHRPSRRDHRTPRDCFLSANHIDPDIGDRELRARPKTTGTIAITLALRSDDADAGGAHSHGSEQRLAVDPQWRRCSCRIACVCTERLANLCKDDIVAFPERPRPTMPMKLSSAAATLQLAGYKPARVVGERHLDAAQAQSMSCPDCGAHGLRYNSYERPSGSSHRGLAWCPECLTTVEL